MKFLVISDLHGNLDVLDKMDDNFKKADAVLFAGDFAAFKHTETGLPALEKLCKKHDTIFWYKKNESRNCFKYNC